jgi:hypothetical protein
MVWHTAGYDGTAGSLPAAANAQLYISLQHSNKGQRPDTAATYWAAAVDASHPAQDWTLLITQAWTDQFGVVRETLPLTFIDTIRLPAFSDRAISWGWAPDGLTAFPHIVKDYNFYAGRNGVFGFIGSADGAGGNGARSPGTARPRTSASSRPRGPIRSRSPRGRLLARLRHLPRPAPRVRALGRKARHLHGLEGWGHRQLRQERPRAGFRFLRVARLLGEAAGDPQRGVVRPSRALRERRRLQRPRCRWHRHHAERGRGAARREARCKLSRPARGGRAAPLEHLQGQPRLRPLLRPADGGVSRPQAQQVGQPPVQGPHHRLLGLPGGRPTGSSGWCAAMAPSSR